MQIAEEIRYLLLAVQREGNRFFSDALKPLHLSPAQAEVLRVLQDHQPLSLRELGGMLICEHGSPSRLVDGVVQRGLVERTLAEHDGRQVILRLSVAGQEMAEQVITIETAMDQIIIDLIRDVPITEIKALFWRYIDGRPTGKALERRMQR